MEEPTPGPWLVGRDTVTDLPVVLAKDGPVIAELTQWGNTEADARLIAASSDLLDAIVDSLNDFEEHGLHAPECDCTYCNGITTLRQAYRGATNA